MLATADTALWMACAFMCDAAASRQAIGLQNASIMLHAAIQSTKSFGGTTAGPAQIW